jgi:NADH dehydrogenase
MRAAASKKRILILGGGFGGVATARYLERRLRWRPDVEIVLVSRDNFLLMTPLLFEVFSGALDVRSCSFPVRAFLRTTRFVEATAEGIDLDRRVVRLASPGGRRELAYDELVLALGSKTDRDMIPGSEHAFTFKTLADALLLRNHVIERFERADVETDPQRRARLLTFVVIGGGLVGVELLGELTAFLDGITPLYEHVNRDEVRFLLLQGAGRIMPEIDPGLAGYGARVLARRPGVELRTNTRVRAIEPGRVHLAEGTVAADTIVLAAGNVPNPVVAGLPVEKDGHGHIAVGPTLRCRSHPEVWALGDCASIPGPDGEPYPNLAQHALRQARVLAGNVAGALDGRPPRAVRLPDPGNDGRAGPRRGVRSAPPCPDARPPGVAASPDLLPDADARLGPSAAHRDRLDLRPAVPAGRRQGRSGQRGGLATPRNRAR